MKQDNRKEEKGTTGRRRKGQVDRKKTQNERKETKNLNIVTTNDPKD